MSKPKAPAAPDYAAAATAQGNANSGAAISTNYLNQVNQNTPYGSLTYGYSTPESGQGHYNAAGQYIPQTTTTTTLAPDQQKLLDQNNAISTQLNDLASRGIGYVDQASSTPIDPKQFGQLATAPQVPTNYTTSIPGASYQTSVNAGNIQSDLDYSKLAAAPSASDFQSQRDQVTDALMQRLNPQISADRQAQEARLANQGINMGSQAYGTANDQLERNVNDQRLAAVLAGSQEQQRNFNNAMGIRQQGVSEINSQGAFHNSAQGQQFSQGLANAGLYNTAQDQTFAQGLTNANLNNQAQGNMFQQGLASGQFTNSAIQQAIQQADYFKNQPLNMLNALRSGNQVTGPTFGNMSGGAQIAAAPVYAATSDAATAANQQYQTAMSGFGSMLSGLGSLGGAAITKFSDRRLKENVKKLWTTVSGLGVYSFNYLGQKAAEIGYMADEVGKIFPNAVSRDTRGFAMVNYGMVK